MRGAINAVTSPQGRLSHVVSVCDGATLRRSRQPPRIGDGAVLMSLGVSQSPDGRLSEVGCRPWRGVPEGLRRGDALLVVGVDSGQLGPLPGVDRELAVRAQPSAAAALDEANGIA